MKQSTPTETSRVDRGHSGGRTSHQLWALHAEALRVRPQSKVMELLVPGLKLGHLPDESRTWTFTCRDSSGNRPEMQVQVTHQLALGPLCLHPQPGRPLGVGCGEPHPCVKIARSPQALLLPQACEECLQEQMFLMRV